MKKLLSILISFMIMLSAVSVVPASAAISDDARIEAELRLQSIVSTYIGIGNEYTEPASTEDPTGHCTPDILSSNEFAVLLAEYSSGIGLGCVSVGDIDVFYNDNVSTLVFGFSDNLCTESEEIIDGYHFENWNFFPNQYNKTGYCVYANGAIYSISDAVKNNIMTARSLASIIPHSSEADSSTTPTQVTTEPYTEPHTACTQPNTGGACGTIPATEPVTTLTATLPEGEITETDLVNYIVSLYSKNNVKAEDIHISVFEALSNGERLVRFTVDGFCYTEDIVIEYIGAYVYESARPTAQIFDGESLYEISGAYNLGIIGDAQLDEIALAINELKPSDLDRLREELKHKILRIRSSFPVGGTPFTNESYNKYIAALNNAEQTADNKNASRDDIISAGFELEYYFKHLERSSADRGKLWAAIEKLSERLEYNDSNGIETSGELKEIYNNALPVYYFEPEQSVIDEWTTEIYAALGLEDTNPTAEIICSYPPGDDPADYTEPVTYDITPTVPSAPTDVPRKAISSCSVSGIKAKTYTGKAVMQSAVIMDGSRKLAPGTDYTVAYQNNKNVGTAVLTITGKGNYKGTITRKFKIVKAENPMTVSAIKTVAASSGKSTSIRNAVTVKNAQGKVIYKTSNKKVTVKNGALVIAKGLKKGGTYKVKITATAKGGKNYKSKTAVKFVKIKVK